MQRFLVLIQRARAVGSDEVISGDRNNETEQFRDVLLKQIVEQCVLKLMQTSFCLHSQSNPNASSPTIVFEFDSNSRLPAASGYNFLHFRHRRVQSQSIMQKRLQRKLDHLEHINKVHTML